MPEPASHCLIVPVWGDAFARHCIDHMIPSLLAVGNLDDSQLQNASPVIAFACPRETRTILQASPALQALSGQARVKFIDNSDLIALHESKYRAMTSSIHRVLAEDYVVPGRTILIFLNPDVICSAGMIAAIDKAMSAGKRVVMVPGLRTRADRVADLIQRFQDGLALSVPPAALSAFATQALHPIDQALFWEDGHYPVHWPSRAMFRDGDGEVFLRGFHMHPIAILCPDPIPRSLDTIDGAFLQECIKDPAEIFVPPDGQEIVVIELSGEPYQVEAQTAPSSRRRLADFGVRHVSDVHWDLFDHSVAYSAPDATPPEALERLYRYVRAHRPRRKVARRWPRFDKHVLSPLFHVIAAIQAR